MSLIPTRVFVAAETFVVAMVSSIVSSLSVSLSVALLGWEVVRYLAGLAGLSSLLPGGAPKEYLPRSIVITGASSGIGEALALEYARPGVFLALTGRNEARLKEVRDKVRQRGADVEIGVLDVTSASNLAEFLQKVDDAHPIDLLIANAGVSGSDFANLSFEERTLKVYEINVTGVFNTINPLLARFKQRRSGQIVINSSISGLIGIPNASMAIYGSTKAAMISYGQSLRSLLSDNGIAVNVIAPAYVRSKMTQAMESSGNTPFIIDSDVAAVLIKEQLQANVPVIVFPTVMYAGIFATRVLPTNLFEPVMNVVSYAFGKKSAKTA